MDGVRNPLSGYRNLQATPGSNLEIKGTQGESPRLCGKGGGKINPNLEDNIEYVRGTSVYLYSCLNLLNVLASGLSKSICKGRELT